MVLLHVQTSDNKKPAIDAGFFEKRGWFYSTRLPTLWIPFVTFRTHDKAMTLLASRFDSRQRPVNCFPRHLDQMKYRKCQISI